MRAIVTLAVGSLLVSTWTSAQTATTSTTTPIEETTRTSVDQPIALPQGTAQVSAVTVDIPVGEQLPVHKHPWPRYGYVLSGTLQVTYPGLDKTLRFSAGDFVVEGVNVWHYGQAVGPDPVRLLVIDQAPPGQSNTLLQPGH